MNRDHVIYLAGLMDGEGTWSIQQQKPPRRFNPRMTMSLKYGHEALELLVATFGGSIYSYPENFKRWSMGRNVDQTIATEALLPYLVIKQDIAQRFLYALSIWPSRKGVNTYGGEKVWTDDLVAEMTEIAHTLNAHPDLR